MSVFDSLPLVLTKGYLVNQAGFSLNFKRDSEYSFVANTPVICRVYNLALAFIFSIFE